MTEIFTKPELEGNEMDFQHSSLHPSDRIRRAIDNAGYHVDHVIDNDLEVDLRPENVERVTNWNKVLPHLQDGERSHWVDSARWLYPMFTNVARGSATIAFLQGEDRPEWTKGDPDADLTDEEYAEWGIEMMGAFNYSPEALTKMVIDIAHSPESTRQHKLALYSMMSMYDEKWPNWTWDGLGRMLKYTATSPTTYLALGSTLGLGLAGRQAALAAGKKGLVAYLQKQIPTAIAGMVEGGAYTGHDDLMRQWTEIEGEERESFDIGRTATATGTGMLFGTGLSLAPGAVASGVRAARDIDTTKVGEVVSDFIADESGTLKPRPDALPTYDMAPEGARAHKIPHQLLVHGDGAKPVHTVTQSFTAANADININNIDATKAANPDALLTPENWLRAEQEAFGGEFLPVPPSVAISYANDPKLIADKLNELSPEMKAAVDEGFEHVSVLKTLYSSGDATPDMTADLFLWGILSRGQGPVQQESAFVEIFDTVRPLVQKVVDGTFSEADAKVWRSTMSTYISEGSPGRQAISNLNDASNLMLALARKPEGSDATVLQSIHQMMGDPDVSAAQIRREFSRLAQKSGIDNKVVSFILLVSGRDDVLVMDRIQGRHLYDDGRFEGSNIYDGIKKPNTKNTKEGLTGIVAGPRGLLLTEMLEDGLRDNVMEAYRMVGRESDASLGRFHWESWVISSDQAVSHSTLDAIGQRSAIDHGVTEGKPYTFSYNTRFVQTNDGMMAEYPLSDGSVVTMPTARHKDFLAFIRNDKNGIVPKGFKVTESKEVPWYDREGVNRDKLDAAARKFGEARPEG